MLFVKLAWRNVLRNRRRTFIAGTAIGMGLAAMIFTDALYKGMTRHMMRAATATFLGDAQLHRDGYRETRDVELPIEDLPGTISRLEESSHVAAFAPRISSFAMIASPRNTAGVSLVGIDARMEAHVSKVDDAIIKGTYLTGGDNSNILIGSKLADLLEVSLGARLVVTTTEAHTGEMSQQLFRLSGIYHFGEEELDKGMAFISLDAAQAMTGLPGQAHEIAITLHLPEEARDPTLPLWRQLAGEGNEAVGWPKILPELESIVNMTSLNILITGLILFAVVALGIINTLFMSIYERMFEFGVLHALGTRRGEVLRLVLLEAAALAVVSTFIGLILAVGITSWVAHTGINYEGIEVAGLTIREPIRPILDLSQFLLYPTATVVLTVFVGIYPGLHAARLRPAAAMRKSF